MARLDADRAAADRDRVAKPTAQAGSVSPSEPSLETGSTAGRRPRRPQLAFV